MKRCVTLYQCGIYHRFHHHVLKKGACEAVIYEHCDKNFLYHTFPNVCKARHTRVSCEPDLVHWMNKRSILTQFFIREDWYQTVLRYGGNPDCLNMMKREVFDGVVESIVKKTINKRDL
jgi:hypothetical protein